MTCTYSRAASDAGDHPEHCPCQAGQHHRAGVEGIEQPSSTVLAQQLMVILSPEDYEAFEETSLLLRRPAKARRLVAGVACRGDEASSGSNCGTRILAAGQDESSASIASSTGSRATASFWHSHSLSRTATLRRPGQASAEFAPGSVDTEAARVLRSYSLIWLLRVAASSFLMSAGDNCGRSTLIVSLFSLAVSGKGGL